MSTTTIRLPEELRIRVARTAEATGTITHGFILDAIAEKSDQAELRADFHAQAEERWAEFLETDESILWEEVRRYLTDRSRGQTSLLSLARRFAE